MDRPQEKESTSSCIERATKDLSVQKKKRLSQGLINNCISDKLYYIIAALKII